VPIARRRARSFVVESADRETLLADPVFFWTLTPTVPSRSLSGACRAVLVDWRDTVSRSTRPPSAIAVYGVQGRWPLSWPRSTPLSYGSAALRSAPTTKKFLCAWSSAGDAEQF